jgi:hypothetical protein
MTARWRLHDPYFRGAGTYEFKLDAGKGETVLPLIVDADGHFYLDGPAPAGINAFAVFAPLTVHPDPQVRRPS